jgi:hypothetical protein
MIAAGEHVAGAGQAPRRRGETALLVAVAVSLQALVWALLYLVLGRLHLGYGFHDLSDTFWYLHYRDLIDQGQRVYRDFAFEYPPLALPLFLLPPAGSVAEYESWFSVEMIALCAAAAGLTAAAAARLWTGLGRPFAAALAFAAAVAAGGAITANRYDVAVAVTLAACMLFLAHRWPAAAAGALGAGVALKLTPAMLLPLVLIVARTRRAILWSLVAFAVVAALPFLPFLNAPQLSSIVTFHAQRPLQVESVPGTAFLIAGALGSPKVSTGNSYGSQSLSAPGSTLVSAISPWLGVLVVAAIYVLVWRRRELLRAAPQCVPLAALTCVLAFTVFNKVLSPQFLVWTFPLVALVVVGEGRGQRLCGVLTLVAIALTQVEFPAHYWAVVGLEPGAVAVVAARNIVLAAATVAGVDALWRLPSAPLQAAPIGLDPTSPEHDQSAAGGAVSEAPPVA